MTKAHEERGTRAIATDAELEEGVLPLGSVVYICTATFAWRGILTLVTPSYYVLDEPVWVFDTGPISDFSKGLIGEDAAEAKGTRQLIERTATVGITVLAR